jgi:DNA phosphorothioation-associated putative methyltransferase
MTLEKNKSSSFHGKQVGGFMYAHKNALSALPTKYLIIAEASLRLDNEFSTWNVIKFNLKNDQRLSLLEYDDFDKMEFPCLHHSCQVDLKIGSLKIRKHSPANPPVLHRKELLIHPEHPELAKFKNLTSELEKLGAFANIVKLGTKLRWQDELKRLKINVKNHKATIIG